MARPHANRCSALAVIAAGSAIRQPLRYAVGRKFHASSCVALCGLAALLGSVAAGVEKTPDVSPTIFADLPPSQRHPKSIEVIRQKIAEWDETPAAEQAAADMAAAPPSGPELERWRNRCLNRLRLYRFLCDVPYDDLSLDDELNRRAEAAARLCDAAKQISHSPPNPGWPEEEYEYARKAAADANLCTVGCGTLLDALDLYMYDSNATNIATVGHRRWLLNPAQRKCGFAWGKEVTAYLAHDASRKDTPEWDYICFPPRGYMPIKYFRKHLERDYVFKDQAYAWHIGLNVRRYAPPTAAAKIAIFALDDAYLPQGDALPLDRFSLSSFLLGDGGAVIFRPDGAEIANGKRYGVQLSGLHRPDGKPAPPIRYVVEFVDL